MKTLIVEDDFLARALLTTLISEYGECHIAVNGKEALEAIERAYNDKVPYDLICLDIKMPVMDGHETLLELRKMEEEHLVSLADATKVIMVTAVDDSKNMMKAIRQGHCEAYLTKPFDRKKLIDHLKKLDLIES
ncbi:response regulator [Desulforhopalus sp. 52FAK]